MTVRVDVLIILQQPLDVIEFDLRTLRIGEPAAQFFQNPANPLHIDFAGNLDRQVVAEIFPQFATTRSAGDQTQPAGLFPN